MNPQRIRIWLGLPAIITLMVFGASAKKTVAQNTFPSSGNVGVGTTSPPRRFTVSNGGAEGLEIGPGNANGDGSNAVIALTYDRASSSWITQNWNAKNWYFGSLGPGTWAVNIRDQVATTSQSFGLLVNAGTNSSDTTAQFSSAAGTNYLYVRGDGNVGIGTTSPGAKFQVDGNAGLFTEYIHASSTTGQSFGTQILAGTNSSDAALQVFSQSGGAPYLLVRGDGNVGIGTTTPGQKLDILGGNINVSSSGGVGGNITISGTINAKYQDVAEWVQSSEQLAAGTVVVLDSTKSNQVTSSSVSYDTRVAGVISERPGLALGEKSDSKVLVATTGRVKVKVDASKGPIHIGDLLVTSDVPGVAMKSEPVEFAGRKMHMPGTLIGKALEPLEKGSGEILVLLSLQ